MKVYPGGALDPSPQTPIRAARMVGEVWKQASSQAAARGATPSVVAFFGAATPLIPLTERVPTAHRVSCDAPAPFGFVCLIGLIGFLGALDPRRWAPHFCACCGG